MKTHGFVYVWHDSKHRKFYVGSHWGEPTDGYVSSSNWMRMAHKRHPETFTRRIVDWVYLDEVRSRFPGLYGANGRDLLRRAKFELLMVEQRWLYMIPENELGTSENQKAGTARYYNITRHINKLWHVGYEDERYLTTREKISQSLKTRYSRDPALRQKASDAAKKQMSDPAIRLRLSKSMKARLELEPDLKERYIEHAKAAHRNDPGMRWRVAEKNRGRKRGEEELRKFIASTRGVKKPQSGKGISEALIRMYEKRRTESGNAVSAETSARMRASQKGLLWWANGTLACRAQKCPGKGWRRGRT